MSELDENTLPGTPIPPDTVTPGWVRQITDGQKQHEKTLKDIADGVSEGNAKIDGLTVRVGDIEKRLRAVELRGTALPIAMAAAAMLLSFAAFAMAFTFALRSG